MKVEESFYLFIIPASVKQFLGTGKPLVSSYDISVFIFTALKYCMQSVEQ